MMSKIDEERRKNLERNKMFLMGIGLDSPIVSSIEPEKPKKERKERTVVYQKRTSERIKKIEEKKEVEREKKTTYQSKPKKILKKGKRIAMYPKKTISYSYEEEDIIEYHKEINKSPNGPRRSSRILEKKFIKKMKELNQSYEEIETSSEAESDTSIIYDDFEGKKSSHEKPIIMFTGFDQKNYLQLYEKEIKELGGEIENDKIEKVTHLISNGLKKTAKLLSAICVSTPYILTMDWIKKSLKHKKFLNEDDYYLNDKGANFSLKESLKRSSEKKIFKNLTFYITPNILPSKTMIIKVIEHGGGKIVEKTNGVDNIYVISCNDDQNICKSLHIEKDKIFTVEFIVQSILHQELQFKYPLF